MLEELRKYKYIKKSISELESDKIVNNLCRNLWKESGYAVAYYLGMINQLKFLATAMGKSACLTEESVLGLIASFKDQVDTPDEIKNLVDIILEEFDYKENDK